MKLQTPVGLVDNKRFALVQHRELPRQMLPGRLPFQFLVTELAHDLLPSLLNDEERNGKQRRLHAPRAPRLALRTLLQRSLGRRYKRDPTFGSAEELLGKNELRLIEDGFPCRQVGAETQRERDTGLSPALNRLHVWWARRPLPASRAALLASSGHASLSPMAFLEQLGITRKRIVLDGIELALPTEFEKKILTADGKEGIRVDRSLLRYLEREQGSRAEQRVPHLSIASRRPHAVRAARGQ